MNVPRMLLMAPTYSESGIELVDHLHRISTHLSHHLLLIGKDVGINRKLEVKQVL